MASTNAARIPWDCLPDESVLTAEQTPDGIDLAEPGATLEIPAGTEEEPLETPDRTHDLTLLQPALDRAVFELS